MLANGGANLAVLSYEEPIVDAFTEVHTLNILKNLQAKSLRRYSYIVYSSLYLLDELFL